MEDRKHKNNNTPQQSATIYQIHPTELVYSKTLPRSRPPPNYSAAKLRMMTMSNSLPPSTGQKRNNVSHYDFTDIAPNDGSKEGQYEFLGDERYFIPETEADNENIDKLAF